MSGEVTYNDLLATIGQLYVEREVLAGRVREMAAVIAEHAETSEAEPSDEGGQDASD